jgi:hypothetical protein
MHARDDGERACISKEKFTAKAFLGPLNSGFICQEYMSFCRL